MKEMVQPLIIRGGWNPGADKLDSIYIASNMANLLDSCKLILGTI